jgi:hypothetical protein
VETLPDVAKPEGRSPETSPLFFWPNPKRPRIATWARGDDAVIRQVMARRFRPAAPGSPDETVRRRDAGTGRWRALAAIRQVMADAAYATVRPGVATRARGRSLAAIRQLMARGSLPHGTPRRRDVGHVSPLAAIRQVMAPSGNAPASRRGHGAMRLRVAAVAAWPRSAR